MLLRLFGGKSDGRKLVYCGEVVVKGTKLITENTFSLSFRFISQCSRCSKVEVQNCLLSTAEDLGEPGRDDYFGSGFVQADLALVCLQNQSCCQERGSKSTTTTTTIASISTTPPKSNSIGT